MANVTVRNLSEETRAALKLRAVRNNRSMEAEIRAILERATREDTGLVSAWLQHAHELSGDDLDAPARSIVRQVDLT